MKQSNKYAPISSGSVHIEPFTTDGSTLLNGNPEREFQEESTSPAD
jgi:hypothetical protein